MAKINIDLISMSPITVATAGTRVPLSATALEVIQVVIQWAPTNTGNVYIGDSTVAAAKCLVLNSGNPSIVITAEDSMADEDRVVIDLANIYVDAATNGDKVNVAYIAQTAKAYNS